MEMTASDYSHLRDYTEDLTLSCPLATQSIRKGLTRWVKEVGVGGGSLSGWWVLLTLAPSGRSSNTSSVSFLDLGVLSQVGGSLSDMTNDVGLFEGLRNQVMGVYNPHFSILFPLWKVTFILCWRDG